MNHYKQSQICRAFLLFSPSLPPVYPVSRISKHCIWLQIESKSDFETSRSLQKGPSPSRQPPPGLARLRDLQDKCMRQSQRMLKRLFPSDPGEAISLCWPGHRSQKDTCHPLAPAGPWDISAESTNPDSSPGWVSSASPGRFSQSLEHPTLGQLPFRAGRSDVSWGMFTAFQAHDVDLLSTCIT